MFPLCVDNNLPKYLMWLIISTIVERKYWSVIFDRGFFESIWERDIRNVNTNRIQKCFYFFCARKIYWNYRGVNTASMTCTRLRRNTFDTYLWTDAQSPLSASNRNFFSVGDSTYSGGKTKDFRSPRSCSLEPMRSSLDCDFVMTETWKHSTTALRNVIKKKKKRYRLA